MAIHRVRVDMKTCDQSDQGKVSFVLRRNVMDIDMSDKQTEISNCKTGQRVSQLHVRVLQQNFGKLRLLHTERNQKYITNFSTVQIAALTKHESYNDCVVTLPKNPLP